ncbi:MAG: transporter, partial [Rhodobacteraceae bacterium]|nr:transporter [Paracoccaceae bacterium]
MNDHGKTRARRSVGARLKTVLTGAVCAAAVMASAGAAGAETMGQALADAYRNSGLLEQNRLVLKAADEDAAQALASLRPVLAWSTSANHEWSDPTGVTSHTAGAGLSLNYTLFDFGV